MQDRPDKPKLRMVRKQIFITPDQNRRLKARAAQSGRAEAELVRQGLDMALEQEAVTEDNWRERLREVVDSIAPAEFDEAFEQRMRRNKREQGIKSAKRLERIRKAMGGG